MTADRNRGFTLVEMVIAISLMGVMAVIMTLISSRHMEVYLDVERRTALATDADIALLHMRQSLEHAVPGSVVVTERRLTLRLPDVPDQQTYTCREDRLESGQGVLADQVRECRFSLRPPRVGGDGVVILWLSMGEGGASVSLLDHVRVPAH